MSEGRFRSWNVSAWFELVGFCPFCCTESAFSTISVVALSYHVDMRDWVAPRTKSTTETLDSPNLESGFLLLMIVYACDASSVLARQVTLSQGLKHSPSRPQLAQEGCCLAHFNFRFRQLSHEGMLVSAGDVVVVSFSMVWN
jgi:hypothetical protein